MSDQMCVVADNGRSERLANLVDLLATAAQAGDFPPSATPVVELLADALAAECAQAERAPHGLANEQPTVANQPETPQQQPSSAGKQPRADLPDGPPPARHPVDRRLEMIDQAERTALEHEDPVRGSLLAFNAGLMRIAPCERRPRAAGQRRGWNSTASSEPAGPDNRPATPLEQLRRMQSLLNAHCRTIKLIFRLSELDGGLAKPRLSPLPFVVPRAPADTSTPPPVAAEAIKSELDTPSPRARRAGAPSAS